MTRPWLQVGADGPIVPRRGSRTGGITRYLMPNEHDDAPLMNVGCTSDVRRGVSFRTVPVPAYLAISCESVQGMAFYTWPTSVGRSAVPARQFGRSPARTPVQDRPHCQSRTIPPREPWVDVRTTGRAAAAAP